MTEHLCETRRSSPAVLVATASLVLYIGLCRTATPQDAPPAETKTKSVSIVRGDGAPVIDGRLDEVIWQQAATVEDLHQVPPDEYSEPSEWTRVYLFYDDDALYYTVTVYEKSRDTCKRTSMSTRL